MVFRELLTVSASPAIDEVVTAPGASAGGTVRTTGALATPGGKAIHVAIIAALLGAPAEVVVPLGGATGEKLAELLAEEPVTLAAVPIRGETRRTLTVVDPGRGDVLELLPPSPALDETEIDALLAATSRRAGPETLVVVSGSAPAGLVGLPARIASAARDSGATVILDTSGPSLRQALSEGAPELIAPNLSEACELLGRPLPGTPTPADLAKLAASVAALGPSCVWLSAGAAGSMLSRDGATVHVRAPEARERINAVGCGDALLGGLAAGLIAGENPIDAARLGTAAATDKLSHLHPARITPGVVRALRDRIETCEHAPDQAAANCGRY